MTAIDRQTIPAFLGDSAMAGLIAAFDWSATSLGPIPRWSAPLRNGVAMMLRSPVPIVLLWGIEGVMLYNDGYSLFAGGRHPGSLGSRVRESWPEVASFNDHVISTVFGGDTLSFRDQPLTVNRGGTPEEIWLDLEYSAVVDDDGMPLGTIVLVTETTARVLAGRWGDDERERLQRMFEQAPSFMATLRGPTHIFDFANAAYAQLVGHREILGKPVAEALPEIVDQGFTDLLDRVFQTGEPFAGQAVPISLQPRPDAASEERLLDFVYHPLRDPGGEISGIFVEGADVTDRLMAERAAEAERAQFQTLAQAMPVQVWTSLPDGQLNWFNDPVYAYTGVQAGDIDGASAWNELVHPHDLPAAGAAWARSLASGEIYETEFRIRRHDGAYCWHLVRALPIRDAHGAITRWIGTNTDIDDRKLVEAQNSRDRDRLWNITQDLMLVAEFSGAIIAINPTATRLLGWEEDEIVGRDLLELIHPDDLERTTAQIAKLESGATTLVFENRCRTRDGDYRLLDWTAVPDSGRVHAVARDITEERRLTRDRERTWTLSPVLHLVLTADGMILSASPSWTQTLGWRPDETIGRAAAAFVVTDEAHRVSARLDDLARGSGAGEQEWVFNTKDGQRRRLVWTTVSEGDTLYSFGRDVTEATEAAEALATAEDALRQSQKMEAVGQLTGGIAHDFNNLLQGITGSLEIIQRRIQQGRTAELERFIQGATTAAGRAAALTHRLLAFSRRQPLDPRPVRVNPLLTSIEDLLRRTLGEQTQLEMVLGGGLWLTLCDPNQLENAVLNLAINARDAMPGGGRLTIETCNAHLDNAYAAQQRDVKPGQYVCLCVTDTGAGMSAETMARAFEPFYTTKPIGQGTGLGLSMIYGFARQSEGYAKIYSELGKGTTFKLYLPRYRGPEEIEEALPEIGKEHVAEAGETILVVEDEPVVRGLIVEVLEELGYRTLEAADGPAGLEILQSRRRIDLLVTDIGLPGLNGRQVADAARLLRPALKILFMTGYAENAALASGFLEPGMSMITKPFAMEAFATRIRSILEEAARRDPVP